MLANHLLADHWRSGGGRAWTIPIPTAASGWTAAVRHVSRAGPESSATESICSCPAIPRCTTPPLASTVLRARVGHRGSGLFLSLAHTTTTKGGSSCPWT